MNLRTMYSEHFIMIDFKENNLLYSKWSQAVLTWEIIDLGLRFVKKVMKKCCRSDEKCPGELLMCEQIKADGDSGEEASHFLQKAEARCNEYDFSRRWREDVSWCSRRFHPNIVPCSVESDHLLSLALLEVDQRQMMCYSLTLLIIE